MNDSLWFLWFNVLLLQKKTICEKQVNSHLQIPCFICKTSAMPAEVIGLGLMGELELRQ